MPARQNHESKSFQDLQSRIFKTPLQRRISGGGVCEDVRTCVRIKLPIDFARAKIYNNLCEQLVATLWLQFRRFFRCCVAALLRDAPLCGNLALLAWARDREP
jgi:hypothetical protein